jgi:L-asparaginase II
MSAPSGAANPALVQYSRGDHIESIHRGALCIATPSGDIFAAAGDVETPIFPRSAVKLIQALPLLESGAAQHLGLDDSHIALACASHNGEARHVQAIAHWLRDIAAEDSDLECGCQPLSLQARSEANSPAAATTLHNNCSGKHAGFIATAHYLGIPAQGYVERTHSIQQRVTATLSEVMDHDLRSAPTGIDGCGIPTYAIPLAVLARGVAQFARPSERQHGRRREAMTAIVRAMSSHPWFVAGTGRFDTEVAQVSGGRCVAKMGAEGVHVAVVPELGLGLAIKIDDGAARVADFVLQAALLKLGILTPDKAPRPASILNNHGEKTGEIRALFELPAA